MAIIPQNPFLFSGTIRENLDPLNQYPDLLIYKALEKCKIHSLVYRLGGLGASLDENGSNLSAGQRQLFCLVRAILHNAKVFINFFQLQNDFLFSTAPNALNNNANILIKKIIRIIHPHSKS